MCPPARCLADILASIEEHDTSYVTRYQLVMHAVCRAIDIELPDGAQVSWHMPQHPHEFDGHTTAEKYERIHAFQRQVAGDAAAT